MKRDLLSLLACLGIAAVAAVILIGEGTPPRPAPLPEASAESEERPALDVEATDAVSTPDPSAVTDTEADPTQSREEVTGLRVQGQAVGPGVQAGLVARLVSRPRDLAAPTPASTQDLDQLTWHPPVALRDDASFTLSREPLPHDAELDWWLEVGLPTTGRSMEGHAASGLLVLGVSAPFTLAEELAEQSFTVTVEEAVEIVVPLKNWDVLEVSTLAIRLQAHERYPEWHTTVASVVTLVDGAATAQLRLAPWRAGQDLRVVAASSAAVLQRSEPSYSEWFHAKTGRNLLQALEPKPLGGVELWIPGLRSRLDDPERHASQIELLVSMHYLESETREIPRWPLEWSLPSPELLYDPSWELRSTPHAGWSGTTLVGRLTELPPGAWEISLFDYHTRRHSSTARVEIQPFSMQRLDIVWLDAQSERIQIVPTPATGSGDEYVLSTWSEDASGQRRGTPGAITLQQPRGFDLAPDSVFVGTISVWNGTAREGVAGTGLHYYGNSADALQRSAESSMAVLPLRKSASRFSLALKDDSNIQEGSTMRLVGLDGQLDEAGVTFSISEHHDLDLHGFPPGRYRLLRVPQDGFVSQAPYRAWAEFEIPSPAE